MFELFNNESTAETMLPGFCDKYVRVAKLQPKTEPHKRTKSKKRSTRINYHSQSRIISNVPTHHCAAMFLTSVFPSSSTSFKISLNRSFSTESSILYPICFASF